MKRLTLPELKALKPGDKVHVRYRKEDDDSTFRTNCTHVVLENNDEQLVTQDLPHKSDCWEWPWERWDQDLCIFDDGGPGEISR